jgi:hypothetical protein
VGSSCSREEQGGGNVPTPTAQTLSVSMLRCPSWVAILRRHHHEAGWHQLANSEPSATPLVITGKVMITLEMGPGSQKAKNTIGPDLKSFLGSLSGQIVRDR